MNIETVNELIRSLESAGELSIKERKYLELAKAYQQLAAESVALKEACGGNGSYRNCPACTFSEYIEAPETPATDRIVAAQRSAFVDEAVAKITESGALTFGDCLVALCQLREVTK